MKLLVGFIAALTVVGVCAQVSNNVSVSFDKEPIRAALDKLFADSGATYKVDADVDGDVTAKLDSVPFEVALKLIIGQVHLTFKREDSMYVLTPAPDAPKPKSGRHRHFRTGTQEGQRQSGQGADGQRWAKIKVKNIPASLMLMRLAGYITPTLFNPAPTGPPHAFFSSTHTFPVFAGPNGLWGFFTSGVFFPLWTGSGWEPFLSGGGR